MDDHLLRVGEFLRRTRLSPKALRLYGERGLLAPARVDGHSGHRWYAPAQVSRALGAHLAASGAARAGALRVGYHGMVTADSDGPVEVAVPFTGTVRPTADLRVRRQPAGHEAVTVLTRAEAEFPRLLDAYDAVARWCDAAGLERTGSPAEVYLTGRDVGPDEPHLEVTWPVGW